MSGEMTIEEIIGWVLIFIAFLILLIVGWAIDSENKTKGSCKGENTYPDDFFLTSRFHSVIIGSK